MWTYQSIMQIIKSVRKSKPVTDSFVEVVVVATLTGLQSHNYYSDVCKYVVVNLNEMTKETWCCLIGQTDSFAFPHISLMEKYLAFTVQSASVFLFKCPYQMPPKVRIRSVSKKL